MQAAEHRLLSQPHEIMWAGWRSTTYCLQQAGWRLSAEQDFNRGTLRLAFKFDDGRTRLYGISDTMDHDYFSRDSRYGSRPMMFICHSIRSDFFCMDREFLSVSGFKAIDAAPQYTAQTLDQFSDLENKFGIFAPPLARTQEIIVEPKSVQACLDRIRELQAPELDAIRERNRRRDREDSSPRQQQVFHAQILSMAA